MVTFSANTDTGVTAASARSTASVPATDAAPTSSGSPAATSEPNAASRISAVNGAATTSARDRSLALCASSSTLTGSVPVACTVSGPCRPVTAGISRSQAARAASSSPPILTRIRAVRPSRDSSARSPVVQNDSAYITPGVAAMRRVSA